MKNKYQLQKESNQSKRHIKTEKGGEMDGDQGLKGKGGNVPEIGGLSGRIGQSRDTGEVTA